MNINPSARRILCYGDSNTWGARPDEPDRFQADERWTGKLQAALGDAYEIIEEGLRGRTTNQDQLAKPFRNGKTYLQPCLLTHNPIDVVILFLGTNDLKTEFRRSPIEVGEALSELLSDIKKYAVSRESELQILLVSPARLNAFAPDFETLYAGVFDQESAQKSEKLSPILQNIASATDCVFFDADAVAQTGPDGVHLTRDSHAHLATALAEIIAHLAPSP